MRWALLILITFPVVLAQANGQEFQPYKIRMGDWLDISVWGEPDVSRTLQVGSDGMISMPLVGELHAEGLIFEEIEGQIREKLAQYLPNPRVTVVGHSSRIHIPRKLIKPKLPETLLDSWPSG